MINDLISLIKTNNTKQALLDFLDNKNIKNDIFLEQINNACFWKKIDNNLFSFETNSVKIYAELENELIILTDVNGKEIISGF